jgi:transketolase
MKKTPGVDMSTGSLGQGLSAANGMALAGKLDKKDYRVYVLLGDGEMAEGQVWEAAMAAAHYKLDNVTAILDFNGLQIDGTTDSVKFGRARSVDVAK